MNPISKRRHMNIYQTDHTKTPEIFTLITAHKNEAAKRHLQQNPSEIALKGWMDDTPLHIAALSGNFEMVQFLIENGANVNAERSGLYTTPLCWADSFEIARYLLDHGATMDDKELYLATSRDKVAIVDLLLLKGAKIDPIAPQYLEGKSIGCLHIYLKNNIKIDGRDTRNSNLLHQLSWLDLPEVFDFAYNNGCPWEKDGSGRTPYDLAKQGQRTTILKHFKEQYPELISYKVENIPTHTYAFESVFFLRQSPTQSDCFIGLTQNLKLVKYVVVNRELIIDQIAAIAIPMIRNFCFDQNGNILIPTADSQLLVLEPNTFQLLQIITLDSDLAFDQIEYLPSKNIFLGSASNWELVLLTDTYKVIRKFEAEDGTMVPKISPDERLIAFLSYDQDTYYNLYQIDKDYNITLIRTFFKDWDNTSSGFSFQQNQFAVSFPYELEYYTFENGKPNKLWEMDLSEYTSKYNASYLACINATTLVVGKGKTLLIIDTDQKRITAELPLDVVAEIKNVYVDKDGEHLFVSTEKELQLIQIKEHNW